MPRKLLVGELCIPICIPTFMSPYGVEDYCLKFWVEISVALEMVLKMLRELLRVGELCIPICIPIGMSTYWVGDHCLKSLG